MKTLGSSGSIESSLETFFKTGFKRLLKASTLKRLNHSSSAVYGERIHVRRRRQIDKGQLKKENRLIV
jgi:hypothetical protein